MEYEITKTFDFIGVVREQESQPAHNASERRYTDIVLKNLLPCTFGRILEKIIFKKYLLFPKI